MRFLFTLTLGLWAKVSICVAFILVSLSISAQAQTQKMNGRIIDEIGEPIIGAIIKASDSKKSTASDTNGEFSIELNDAKSTIDISLLGYSPVTMSYSPTPATVVLKEDNYSIDQVVIVGYQKMRKGDITGAVASVKASELNLTTPTIGQALVGKVAGVQVSQVSGAPYATTKIRVRGTSSINASSDPLYVIDGYPANSDIFINPEDVESIEILKDAASSAIYGSRASGGVVMITTKRGKEGRVAIDFDYMLSINSLARKVEMLNSEQFVDLFIDGHNKAYRDLMIAKNLPWDDAYFLDNNAMRTQRYGSANNSMTIPDSFYDFSTGKAKAQQYDTNWQDELYRTTYNSRYNLSFSGGKSGINYLISGSYQDMKGIMIGTDQKRYNLRANIDAKVSDRFNVGANVAYTNTENNEVNTGRFHESPAMAALVYAPIFGAYNEDGSYKKFEMSSMASEYAFQNNIENPMALAAEIKNWRKTSRSVYNVFGEYRIIDNLSAKLSLGTYRYDEKYEYYRPTSLTSGTNAPYSTAAIAAATARSRMLQQEDYLGEFTLNYNYSNKIFSVNGIIGGSAQRNIRDVLDVQATGFTDDKIPDIMGGGADPSNFTRNSGTGKSNYSLLSAFGRVNLGLLDRYHLTATLRTDGCSLFGQNNRWAYFPSVSAGWTLSNEDFYKSWFGQTSSLKIRASWGLSGNNGIPNYETQQTMGKTGVVIGSNVATIMYPGGFRDTNLGWESTSQLNVGMDLSLFNNRLSFMFNYYDSYTKNLLFQQTITAVSGSTSMLTNLPNSTINNHGFDIQLDGAVVSTSKFTLRLAANLSYNRNKVLDLGGAGTILSNGAERSYPTHITMEGQPIGMFWGYKVQGQINEADMANLAIDDQYYNPSTKQFIDGYKHVGPARSLANSTKFQLGDLYFEDINADGVVDEKDKQIIGNPHPDFTYGFNLSANFFNFDFSASFNGVVGGSILDGQCYYLYNMEGSGNQYLAADQRYRDPSNPGNGSVYRASRTGTQSNNTRLTSFYLEDGSFLRCTNITLGYNIPRLAKATNNTIKGIRIYVALDNPFTFQTYRGYNPEVDYGQGSNLTPGVDYGMYPLMSSTNVGIKLSF